MAYLSLYRKWRPQTFDDIAGQPHVVQTLKNAIDKGRISHAYLFTGPRGTGKTSTARILAKAINCEKGPTPTPCNRCESCKSVNDGSSIDVLELDAASNRKVDEIRDLLEKIPYSSTQGGKKVYIIDEVHMLTPESFNTLLKTLEEPPEHVIFVLATTEPHKVLPTILSRCQRFDFRRISVADIKARLGLVAEAEKIDIDEAALSLIAYHSQGSLRDALGALEQLSSYSKETITLHHATSLLGLTDSELLLNFTDILADAKLAEGILFIDELIEKGVDLRQFIQDMLSHLRNLLLIQNAPGIRVGGIIDEFAQKFNEQAAKVPGKSLMFFINTLSDVYAQARWATDIRLLFEIALFKMANASDNISMEGILYRIERLESILLNGTNLPTAKVDETKDEAKDKVRVEKSQKAKKQAEAAASGEATVSRPGLDSAVPKIGGDVTFEMIKKSWPQVLKLIKDKKPSRYGFYAAAKLRHLKDGKLIIALKEGDKVFVESAENLKLLQSALKIATGYNIPVTCELDREAVKTVAVTDSQEDEESLLAADDYIKLVQDTFGAKIVEDISINQIKDQEDK
ncbi:MAG: DNA polymerase III subunit gamma/tau [Firmicutes bacterium]|nr:DNA polymerase III subunit gamma/tau [Bacillota bacterium]